MASRRQGTPCNATKLPIYSVYSKPSSSFLVIDAGEVVKMNVGKGSDNAAADAGVGGAMRLVVVDEAHALNEGVDECGAEEAETAAA